MDIKKYKRKCSEELHKIAWKDSWTDADRLKWILYNIDPYSKWWRWGMVRALKRAIKLLEAEDCP